MIDFDKLDKDKTYVGLEYGTSAISKVIRSLTRQFCYNRRQIPSHVLAVVFNPITNKWMIYESHMTKVPEAKLSSGVRVYNEDILKKYFPNVVKHCNLYPCEISLVRLNNLLGLPYGTGDIVELLHASLHKSNGKQKDRKGLICSEYIARCYYPICKYLNLKPHCITPAHWLKYFIDNNIKHI